jgi:phosphoglycolate phosphatase-like HAD superfamily hydrolase
MIFLFDLDDTLLDAHSIRVPRQTWHALKQVAASQHVIGIVTNNSLGRSLVAQLGLGRYVPASRLCIQHGGESRVALIERWLSQQEQEQERLAFYYFDDRLEHCQQVTAHFGMACVASMHVLHAKDLHLLIKEVLGGLGSTTSR